jgi:hypothetical protein
MINKHYNRIERFNNHQYIENLGDNKWKKDIKYNGYVKCKLMHGANGSILVPDLVFYQVQENGEFKWIQPLAFRANQIYFLDDDAQAHIMIDISCETTVTIKFNKSNFLKKLNDNSELYECNILSSLDITGHYTGEGFFNENNVPFIKAYHHTSNDSANKIKDCGYLKNSKWNIGGTKELRNVGYVYFTPLNELKYNSDLVQIAMSENGSILLSTNNGGIRRINIYRRSIGDFQTTLEFWIDTQLISPSHLFKRRDSRGSIFYLVASPFIIRIGMEIVRF